MNICFAREADEQICHDGMLIQINAGKTTVPHPLLRPMRDSQILSGRLLRQLRQDHSLRPPRVGRPADGPRPRMLTFDEWKAGMSFAEGELERPSFPGSPRLQDPAVYAEKKRIWDEWKAPLAVAKGSEN